MITLQKLLRELNEYEGEYYLTQEECQLIDPTGKGRQNVQRMKSCTAHHPMPIRKGWEHPSRPWEEFLKLQPTGVASVDKYEAEMLGKVGPQGGPIPWSCISEMLDGYYRKTAVRVPEHVKSALSFFLRRIDETVSTYGMPQVGYVWTPDNTAAGFPYFGKKTSAVSLNLVKDQQLRWVTFPDNLGTRYSRLKDRVIHCDALTNVSKTASILAVVRNWLRTYLPEYFSAWLNPNSYLRNQITHRYDTWSNPHAYMCDYRHMDELFGIGCVEALVMPVYKKLLPSWEYDELHSAVRWGYREPVFLGDYVRCGWHGTLSGQAWTGDFETIASVIIGLSLLIYHRVPLNEADIYACGDDLSILSKREIPGALQTFVRTSTSLGMEANLEKQEESTDLKFLRRIYYKGAPRSWVWNPLTEELQLVMLGVYPRPLTYNALINPEYPPDDFDASMTAALQICDVLYGHPFWAPYVQQLWGNCNKADRHFRFDAAPIKDWKERVYGILWNYRDSHTFELLVKQNIIYNRTDDEASRS